MPFARLVLLAGLVLAFAVLWVAQAVFVPVALAILITFLLSPVCGALEHRGLGRVPSVLLVVLLTFSTLGAAVWVLGTQVAGLGHELPKYQSNIRQKVRDVRWLGRGGSLEKVQQTVKETVKEAVDDPKARRAPTPVVVQEEPATQLRRNLSALGPWLASLGMAGVVVVLVPFMLLERQELRNRVLRLIGYSRLAVTTKALDEASARVSRYLLMQTIINATFGGSVALGLFVLGVPYALLWGVLAMLLRFIPYVGPWVAAISPILLSLAVFPGWTKPLLVIALFVVLELFSNMVMETLLYSNTAGVSEVGLLVAVAFWTWLWGPVGLMMATPLTVCLMVFAKYVPEAQFVTVLMGDEPVIDPDAAFYQRLLASDRDEATAIVAEYVKSQAGRAVYEAVVLPALCRLRRDRARGAVADEDERTVLAIARDVLGDLREDLLPPALVRDEGTTPAADRRPRLRVLACPAQDGLDHVALVAFEDFTAGERLEIEAAPADVLSAEVVALASERAPGVVLIAAVPPGGLARCRYLCKRLRARLPDVPIVVGRWGAGEDASRSAEILREAGATDVGYTLAEVRDRLLQFAQVRAGEAAGRVA